MHPQSFLTNATLGRPFSTRNMKRQTPKPHLPTVTRAPRKRELRSPRNTASVICIVCWPLLALIAILALLITLS